MSSDKGQGDSNVKNIDYDKLFEINPEYMKEEFVQNVRDTLLGKTDNSKPFPHISMDNFLLNPNALDILRDELDKAKWNLKINDMFTMKSTTELINFDITVFPALKNFRRFLATIGREFMMKITGVELNNRIDIAGSCYEHTHVLLPHDDRMEERKFAFIFYLSPDWKEEYGGQLNLYNADNNHYPTNIAKKIVPKENNFTFFLINHQERYTSWHSVEEVVAPNQRRLTLNGWFHVDDVGPVRTLVPRPPINKITPSLMVDYEDVRAWINPIYIAQSEQKRIKSKFASRSELVLDNFLTEEKYKEALNELKSAQFEQLGPVNVRNVDRLDESKLPKNSALKQLLNLMRSDAMTLLITQWTGIHLYDLKSLEIKTEGPPTKKSKNDEQQSTNEKPKKDVKIASFIDRYSYRSYSLLDDLMAADSKNDGFCFDLLLFFTENKKWDSDTGGYITYFAVNEKDELLRVEPISNRVGFVFREPEVLNFTKYVNSKAENDTFYLLNCSYYSNTTGDSETESSEDEFIGEYESEEELGSQSISVEPEDFEDETGDDEETKE